MNQEIFLPLILLVSLVVVGIIFPSCESQSIEKESCKQPFECGSLRNISYPFYGGNRSFSCGYPGFQLSCEGEGAPFINISSITYRVLAINNQTQTLRVARNDLWSTLCPQIFRKTILNSALYTFDSSANDEEVTLVYGCLAQQFNVPVVTLNMFRCNDEVNGIGFFVTKRYTVPKSYFTCAGPEIPVRISQAAAADYDENPSASKIQTSLQSGFWIRWSVNNSDCESCVRSGGTCSYDQNSTSFACNCTDGSTSEPTCTNTSNKTGSGKGISKKYAIILGVSLPVPILLLTVYCIVHFFLVKESDPDVEKFLVTHGSLAPKRYSYYEIKKMTKSFQDKLGQGGFGTVYKGELPDGQPIAVKVLTRTRDDKDAEDFINEVASISQTSHVNIVNLLGFCFGRKKRALVYEFMPNKSLDNYINNAERSLEWKKLYEIAVGVARGLEYLHRGCNTRIVHFDIKPQNILLDEDFSPKISDFGLAKLFKKRQSIVSMLGMRGTIGYIAPEVFSRNFGAVSHKSDVYGYGMMLLEMAEARKMVEAEPTQSSENYFPDNIYELVLLKNEKLDVMVVDEKEESEIKMLMVGIWCIQTAPSDRPSMSKVLEMLEGSLQSIQIPPKPSFPLQSGAVQFSSSMNMDSNENST